VLQAAVVAVVGTEAPWRLVVVVAAAVVAAAAVAVSLGTVAALAQPQELQQDEEAAGRKRTGTVVAACRTRRRRWIAPVTNGHINTSTIIFREPVRELHSFSPFKLNTKTHLLPGFVAGVTSCTQWHGPM
jgi:hypothetical protein